MRKVGLFGGTFSPPHVGHRRALEYFIRQEGLSRVFVMPTFIPPHKVRSDMTGAEDRFEMCRLAFGDIPEVEVSDLEIRRGGKSFTALTLEALQKEGERLVFLCGTDMFLTLERWKNPEIIFRLATICYVRRENDPETTLLLAKKEKDYAEKFGAKIIPIISDITEVSSSEIRFELESGASQSKYISQKVMEYIRKRGLYR